MILPFNLIIAIENDTVETVCEIGKYFCGVTDCHARQLPYTGVPGSGFWTHSRPTQPLPGWH